jgi:hypothetical protein
LRKSRRGRRGDESSFLDIAASGTGKRDSRA